MTFLEIALGCIARGWCVIPCKGKKALIESGKGTKWEVASNDEAQVRAWWTQWPDANVAIAGRKSGLAILDVDHGLTSLEDFERWRVRNGLPDTYAVRTGRRPEFGVQMYYAGVISGVGVFHLGGCSGQVKSEDGYVMAAGSIHPDSGERYAVLRDAPIAPVPDVVRDLRKPVAVPTNNSKVPKTKWNLPIHEGEDRTGFLMEQTGAMRNLGCGKDAIFARMVELNEDPEIIADPVDGERLERTAANCAKYPVPAQGPAITIGDREPKAAKLPERVKPIYPIDVWEGTAPGEFAKLCAHDNNIPAKMYAEAFRCVLGAVVGDRLSCPAVEGALPRSYTVLVAPKGKGKGSAIRRAIRFFMQSYYGARKTSGLVIEGDASGLLSGERDFIWKPKGIGAWMAAASSVPGMARLTKDLDSTIKNKPHLTWGSTLPRILSVHEEMKTFLSALFIEGGVGSGMEGVICQLWDDVSFHGTATGTREAAYGEMLFSLLAGVTEQDWFDLLSRGNAVGGGLMSRFNMIGTEGEYENVSRMNPPDFTTLQETFMPRVIRLEDVHARIMPTEGADRIISEWADNLPEGSERMNVHAWRAALILAWLKHEDAISAKTAEDAVLLGQYQADSHDYYRTKSADNATAKVQGRIVRALELKGPMPKRELQKRTNAHRDGTELWNRALAGLLQDERVGKRDETYYLAE
jgi:hypothetical protein